MPVTRISLRNFRCFKQATFDITPGHNEPGVTIIEGANGSGKTSILEALHYGCHLRSFRTHLPIELYNENQSEFNGFTINITTSSNDTISIGVSGKKRLIKVNNVPVTKYDDLIASYKVVTFIEDDLACIKGYPESRRAMVDNALSVQDPHYHTLLKSLRKILDQRTKVLQNYPLNKEQYDLWTDELMTISKAIVEARKKYLSNLSTEIEKITQLYDTKTFLTIDYREKRPVQTDQELQILFNDELRAQRNLYGPHLDDIDFFVYERSSRSFASRGQQKLVIMFLKIAQARLLLGNAAYEASSIVFLIDDFLTDFDETRIKKLLALLFELRVQLVITTPQPHSLLYSLCSKKSGYKLISLDSVDPERVIVQQDIHSTPEVSV